MKNKTTALFVLLALASLAHAEFFVGGTASVVYSQQHQEYENGFYDEKADHGVLQIIPRPMIGYNITDRLALGLGIGTTIRFYFGDYDDADYETFSTASAFLFCQYFFYKSELLAFGLQGRTTVEVDFDSDYDYYDKFAGNLLPLLDVSLTKNWGLLLNFGSIGFEYQHAEQSRPGADRSYTTYVFSAGIHTGAGLGVRYNL